MQIRTVRCTSCGETRIGRRVDGETEPIRRRCQKCGSADCTDAVD